MNNNKLDNLKRQLREQDAEIDNLKLQIRHKQNELQAKKKAAQELKEKVDRIENPNDIKISEHALFKYFERVHGFDLEAVKREILSPQVLNLISKPDLWPSGQFPTGHGFSVLIKDNTVVTILI